MEEFKSGKAIIFNTEEGRDGSVKDVELLQGTLQNMNVSVTTYALTNAIQGNNIDGKIKEHIANENFDAFDYVIVAFFSHGLDDEQIKDGQFNTNVQRALLGPLFKIESLHNKLKWIIVQACRGKFDYHDAIADGPSPTLGQKYFHKSFACQEGNKAYRDETGSIFIKVLCKNLEKFRKTEDLMYILNETRENIAQNEGITQQTRDVGNIGGRRFYFTRGFVENND